MAFPEIRADDAEDTETVHHDGEFERDPEPQTEQEDEIEELLELQEGLSFLATRLGSLELDGEPEFGTISGIYGLESLPIRFTV